MVVTFDSLKAARRLQDEAGFNETQASVLVSTIAQGLGENLATKDDLTREIAAVRGEIAVPRSEAAEIRTDFLAAIRAFEQRLYVRVGAMITGATLYLTAVIAIATAILLNAI